MGSIKILIVDDSRIYRGILEKALSDFSEIKIIGSVRNGQKAIEFIKTNPPDIVSLDVEMDEMDGLETLKEIQKLNKAKNLNVKVIMVSSQTSHGATVTIESLKNGALDFVTKPSTPNPGTSIEFLKKELGEKILFFGKKSDRTSTPIQTQLAKTIVEREPVVQKEVIKTSGKYESIIIGVSTGGPKALTDLMPKITQGISIPIFIVQHMPPTFTKALAESLNMKSPYTIVEAEDNQVVQPKHVYIAPGGKHMIIRKINPTLRKISITDQPAEEGCKPSVNIMFRSAAMSYGDKAFTIILTGMGADGSKALSQLKRAGSFIMVQDEQSSVVWGMPGSAVETGLVNEVVPLNKMAEKVHELL